MSDATGPVVDFRAARDATKEKRLVVEAHRRSADPFEALTLATAELARVTHGLAVNLAAVETATAANSASLAKLASAVETLTRAMVTGFADLAERLPPA